MATFASSSASVGSQGRPCPDPGLLRTRLTPKDERKSPRSIDLTAQLPQLTMQVSDCIDTPRVKMPLHGGAFDRFVEFEGLEQVALFGREAPGADDSLVVDVDGVFLDLAQYRQRAPW